VERIRLRWVGHRLEGDAIVTADPERTEIGGLAEGIRAHLPHVDEFLISVRSSSAAAR
jgi:hypothetical protein